MSRRLFAPLALAVLFAAAAAARPEADKEPARPDKKGGDRLVSTHHRVTVEGKEIEYEATAGTLAVKDEEGKKQADLFFVAYTRSGVKERSRRPITFAFNGGPGSSSVWLHLGALGPRRVALQDSGEPLPPPYKLVDNDLSILDLTDLVFIDPVTTGYSRPAEGVEGKKFHGVQQDVESVGDFIRLYLTRYERWDSPKYLAGESYGTTRAAALSGYLQDRHGIYLNGILLISSVLNFETLSFTEGNDLPYALFLPTYTATAWYHKKLPAELQGDLKKALAEAEAFAEGEYVLALMKGGRLSAEERAKVGKKLARLTGLSDEFVVRSNLRVDIGHFTKELLRDERRTVGRFDSRYKGIDLDAVGERPDYDPSYAAVQGAYTATLNNYVRKELGFESDLPYEILTSRVQPWDFGSARNRYLNVAPTLRQAMTRNRDLRVFVACGYYDLATPYFAADYTVSHLGLDPAVSDHVTLAYYEAGHMMYVHRPSFEKLRKDMAAFYRAAGKE